MSSRGWPSPASGVSVTTVPTTGPSGPSTKARWTDPVTWHEGLRDASVTVPAPDGDGNDLIDTFCAVVGWGSIKAIGIQTNPTRFLVGLVVLLYMAAWLCRRTTWKVTPALPLVRRRRAGELVTTAGHMYIHRPLLWVPIGLATIPIGVAVTALIALLAKLPVFDAVLSLFNDSGSIAGTARTRVERGDGRGGGRRGRVPPIAKSPTESEAGNVTWRTAMIEAISRWRSLVYVIVRGAITVFLLLITTVLAVFGIERFVRYQFIVQSVMFEGLPGRPAMRRSVKLTRGRWWHTAIVSGLITGFMVWSGTVVSLLVLVGSSSMPLWIPAVVSWLVTALITPVGGIALSLLYGDAVAEELENAAGAGRYRGAEHRL